MQLPRVPAQGALALTSPRISSLGLDTQATAGESLTLNMEWALNVQSAGRIDVEDVLEVVFGEFCVGK